MQISALEVWHVNNKENNSQMCSLESGSVDENTKSVQPAENENPALNPT
mgnify:CR=1 FL=1